MFSQLRDPYSDGHMTKVMTLTNDSFLSLVACPRSTTPIIMRLCLAARVGGPAGQVSIPYVRI